jgi:hypothetical protein
MNKLQTYSLIGKILALDKIPEHRDAIIKITGKENMNWEKFVLLSDFHLVLQSLFPKIFRHQLLDFFPDDLIIHLHRIYELNAKRNEQILQQISRLNQQFKQAEILPLYMKGAGNLLDNVYSMPGERILHDIDILLPLGKSELAAGLLIDSGYRKNDYNQAGQKKSERHYPILFKPGEPAYVELHFLPVGPQYSKYFDVTQIFANAKPVKEFLVMSDEHKMIHNFIHAHLDHLSRYYAREYLRNLYDLLVLSFRKDPELVFSDFRHYRRNSTAYLDIFYSAFDMTPSFRKKPWLFLHTYRTRYNMMLRYPKLGILTIFIIRVVSGYILKPITALYNKEVRTNLLLKIKDPGWYRKQGVYYKRLFRNT